MYEVIIDDAEIERENAWYETVEGILEELELERDRAIEAQLLYLAKEQA